MKTSVKIEKAFMLLFLIYHYNKTLSHSKNLAFFGLSDDKECEFFTKELDLSKAELNEIVDLLAEADFLRLVKVLDTTFVFLNEKALYFVQKQNFSDQSYPLKGLENVDNGKKE